MGQKRLGVRTASKPGPGSGKAAERTGGWCTGVQLSKNEKFYYQSKISFFSAIFQGVTFKLFNSHHPGCLDTVLVRRERSIQHCSGKETRKKVHLTSPGTLGRALLRLISLKSRRGKIRTTQRTCPLYSERHRLNMPSFRSVVRSIFI